MEQTLKILKAWKSYLVGETSAEAKERAEICKGCPSAVLGSYEQLMPDYSLKDVQGLKCNECGCPLSTKLRAENETCPIKKW